MKNKLIFILTIVFLYGCSDEQTPQEKNFIKYCYYGTNTQISKNECSCIYKDLLKSSYTEQEMANILTDNYPAEQLIEVKNNLTRNLLKSYQTCK